MDKEKTVPNETIYKNFERDDHWQKVNDVLIEAIGKNNSTRNNHLIFEIHRILGICEKAKGFHLDQETITELRETIILAQYHEYLELSFVIASVSMFDPKSMFLWLDSLCEILSQKEVKNSPRYYASTLYPALIFGTIMSVNKVLNNFYPWNPNSAAREEIADIQKNAIHRLTLLISIRSALSETPRPVDKFGNYSDYVGHLTNLISDWLKQNADSHFKAREVFKKVVCNIHETEFCPSGYYLLEKMLNTVINQLSLPDRLKMTRIFLTEIKS
jgi:hypothetical protein